MEAVRKADSQLPKTVHNKNGQNCEEMTRDGINVTNLQTSRTFLCSGRGMPTSDGPHADQTSYKLP